MAQRAPPPFYRIEMIGAVVFGTLMAYYLLDEPIKAASLRLQEQKRRRDRIAAGEAASAAVSRPADGPAGNTDQDRREGEERG